MSETKSPLWTNVDEYLARHLLPDDPVLAAALDANNVAGLPSIDVAPNQGKLLYLLARMRSASRILEIGTLGGYSTIWLARALPAGGRLVTLEREPRHAQVARANLQRAGLSERVEIRTGPALASMQGMRKEAVSPFDFIFIDADKDNYPGYLEQAVHLSQKGTVIVADNVIRDGEVIDPDTRDPRVQGVRRFFEELGRHPALTSTALQTVGSKGYDGFTLSIVE